MKLKQAIAPSNRLAAHVFHLLSDDLRLGVVALLAQGGEMTVGELTEALGRSQPAISNGLHLLRLAQLVDFRCRGKTHSYRLTSPLVQELLAVADRHLGRVPGESPSPLEEPPVPDPADDPISPETNPSPSGTRTGSRRRPETRCDRPSPAPSPHEKAPPAGKPLFPTRIRLAMQG